MRVLHVIDGLGRGGAERMLVDLANLASEDGHEVHVCVTGRETALAADLDHGIPVTVLGRRRRVTPVAFARLAALARKADVVHAHMRSNAAAVTLLRIVRLISTPIVFHDHFGSIERDASRPLWLRLGRGYIDQYVGVYAKLAAWAVRAGIPASRVETIPNALDLRRLTAARPVDVRRELGLAPEQYLAILVASIRRDKGIEVMLRALASARNRDRFHVAIVGGDGDAAYAAEMRELTSELGLGKHVTFLGARADVPGVLLGADLGLVASHSESGPLVLIEYLAASLPFVATRVGDIGNRLAQQGAPGFVAAGDVEAFARELDAFAALAPAARRERAQQSRALLQAGWDLASVMPQWYALYSRTIRGRV